MLGRQSLQHHPHRQLQPARVFQIMDTRLRHAEIGGHLRLGPAEIGSKGGYINHDVNYKKSIVTVNQFMIARFDRSRV